MGRFPQYGWCRMILSLHDCVMGERPCFLCLFCALLLWTCLACAPLSAQEPITYTYTLKPSDKAKLERAVAEYEKGHYRQSAEQLRKLAEKYPDDPDIYLYLGLNSVKRDFNRAGIRRYFSKVVQLDTAYPDAVAHYYMAVVHYTDNKFAEAEAELNRFFARANSHGTPASDAVYQEASNYLYWSAFLAEAHRNMAPFNPKVIRGVSSADDEILPFITHDGRSAYYLRQVSETNGATFYAKEQEEKSWRLFVSHWGDTCFSNGVKLSQPFNVQKNEGGVTLTADNRHLYYSVVKKMGNGYNNCDIYGTELVGGRWQPVAGIGGQVNGDATWESQPSVSADGQWLYFASNRPGGLGGIDIWRCRRNADGTWGEPRNLGSSVNTPGNEKCPFIHADGHTLYFASDGWQGFGGYDMYFVDLANDEALRPGNLGLPINTEGDDICFGVRADGKQAYYAGYDPNYNGVGGRDVLAFDLYEAARPESMRLYRGSVVGNDGKPIRAEVTVRHGGTESKYRCDEDGMFVVMVSAERESRIDISIAGYHGQQFTNIPQEGNALALPNVITLTR